MKWMSLHSAGFAIWLRFVLLLIVMLLVREDVRVPGKHAPTAPAAPATTSTPQLTASKPLPPQRLSINDADAARFLAQATFGPTLEDIAHLRQVGYWQWFDEQVAMPPSYQVKYLDAMGPDAVYNAMRESRMEAWFLHALGGQDPFDPAVVHRDQLRQRVAFALSEIFVVSDQADAIGNAPYGLTSYYDLLARNAFGNYRQLLEDVTLHPVMGLYLSALGNQKPDPARNIRPDENYAREVLQLFSVGLVRLNNDGTPMRDTAGRPLPTYDQYTVKGFAHVFTGFTFNGCAALDEFQDCYFYDFAHPAWRTPMEAQPGYHSPEAKQLLDYPGVSLPGGLLGAGGTPQGDLKAALDNIFRHPNVGPFIGRQLIQRLVTSNPSPVYVSRVAAAFNNNGAGVRGDMKAVVKAILLDPEARVASAQPPNFGKVREPILRLTHTWRALNARTQTGRMSEHYPEYYLAQAPLRAPSVFNFFSPNYRPSGELSELGLAAPELQLATDYMLPKTHNAYGDEVFWYYIGNPETGPNDINVDLGRDMPLAATPAALLDRYNLMFMSGQMSPRMRQVLLDRLNEIPNTNSGRERVQEALYLIVNSPEYTVQK
ncbi:MAG TPA: DUF1800 domain-containing protein [Lysobacter sp.]